MTELTDDAYLQPVVAAELTSLADLLDAAADLALVICGRSVPTGRLEGAPLARAN